MVPKLLPAGRSFAGLANYLSHDPEAQTTNRVAWTHSLNCAHDDVASVVHEMYTTTLDAELLKQQAGVRAGGRALEKPVKHLSLNWHASDEPSREHMIATTEEFMRHMGWQDHQALIVRHTDRDHPHVHVMINVVHPETGLKLDDGFEKRRVQEWALEYERAQGVIHCEQRLLDKDQREPSPTREAWEKLKESEAAHNRQYDPSYMASADSQQIIAGEEWNILKEYQRMQREAHFAEGKEAFSDLSKAIYREVREEFREDWAFYYGAKRDGLDAETLAAFKADLLARQNDLLDERRSEAFPALREQREAVYADLRAEQKDMLADLRQRQSEAASSPHLLDLVNYAPERMMSDPQRVAETDRSLVAGTSFHDGAFRQAADEVCAARSGDGLERRDETVAIDAHDPPAGVRDGSDAAIGMGLGALGGLATISERLFDGFFGGGDVVKPPPVHKVLPPTPEFKPENAFKRVADQARQEAETQETNSRNQAYWEERERTRD